MKRWLTQWLHGTSSAEEENAQESDVDKELEHDEKQPQKRVRKVDEKSIVIYGQEQGLSSNSQLTDQLDWLPCNSSSYPKAKTLVEKMGHLSAREHDVLKELKHAEFQPGKKRREEVHHWLTLVQSKIDEIESMKKDAHGSTCNSNLSGCIERFIEEVDDLIQRGKFPNGLVLLDEESTRLPLLLGIKPVGENFQENTAKILGWLRNQEHCIIGVYGMGGVGKTTLLMHIHNLSLEVDERRRAAILYSKIVVKGQIVLILDDMWERFLGDKVGIPLEGGSCKVILSTRSHEVCRKKECKDFVIKTEILSTDEAWGLFVDKLGHYDTLE
ncbi:Disease resistance protein RPS5 [Bienertia sinuspersici]